MNRARMLLVLCVGLGSVGDAESMFRRWGEDERDINGDTPLHLATTEDRARLLILGKASIEAVNKQGLTPLLRAAECGREDVVRILLESRANVHAKSLHGKTAYDLVMADMPQPDFAIAQQMRRIMALLAAQMEVKPAEDDQKEWI